MKTYKLSRLYELAGYDDRSRKVAFCSTFSAFGVTQAGKRYLRHTNRCRDRLCPICSALKARATARDLSGILDWVEKVHPDVRYIFLTLTVRDVPGPELPAAIKRLTAAWRRMTLHRQFERSIGGFFRSVEITRGDDPAKPKDYHPHLHVVLAVPEAYFDRESGLYLTHDWWMKHWRKACGLDYDPYVHVERVYASAKAREDAVSRHKSAEYAAALEAAKYPVKDADYISSKLPEAEAVQVVQDYATAVKGRRFTAYGGWLKEAAQELKITDDEPDDLQDIHDQTLREDICILIEQYRWSFGAKDYVLEGTMESPEIEALKAASDDDRRGDATLYALDTLEGDQLKIPGMPATETKRPE